MRSDTKRGSGKGAAILCCAVVIGLLLFYLAAFLFPVLGGAWNDWLSVGVLILCAASALCLIGGVAVALRQRLRELESGEEEDAKRY